MLFKKYYHAFSCIIIIITIIYWSQHFSLLRGVTDFSAMMTYPPSTSSCLEHPPHLDFYFYFLWNLCSSFPSYAIHSQIPDHFAKENWKWWNEERKCQLQSHVIKRTARMYDIVHICVMRKNSTNKVKVKITLEAAAAATASLCCHLL